MSVMTASDDSADPMACSSSQSFQSVWLTSDVRAGASGLYRKLVKLKSLGGLQVPQNAPLNDSALKKSVALKHDLHQRVSVRRPLHALLARTGGPDALPLLATRRISMRVAFSRISWAASGRRARSARCTAVEMVMPCS